MTVEPKTPADHKAKDDPVVHWLIWGIAALGTLAMTGLGVWWLFVKPRRDSAQLTTCEENLKNIAIAYEMYSTDFAGKYPPHPSLLAPNYLKTIPECPATHSITYQVSLAPNAPMNTEADVDYYYLECYGGNHRSSGITANYPAYSGIQGLVERAPQPATP